MMIIPVAEAMTLASDTTVDKDGVTVPTVASLVIAGDPVIIVVETSEGVTEGSLDKVLTGITVEVSVVTKPGTVDDFVVSIDDLSEGVKDDVISVGVLTL